MVLTFCKKIKEAVGMFAKNNGRTHTAENAGTISLENPTGKIIHH